MDREPDPRLKPEYAQGELLAVTTVGNEVEAEMLRDMLLEEGIPSMIRPAGTFQWGRLMGATAPHEVVVRESGYDLAYELVHGSPPEPRRSG